MSASSNSEIEPILGIQFSIFSPDEIERRSVVEITSNATYEGNEPKIGGLFDPRMGVLENGKQCRSCGQSNNGCPGHFAHYRLGRPVYYIQFLPMILNILSCVCVSCSKLLVDKEMRTSIKSKKGEGRWKELMEASGNISRCGQETEDGCGARQPDRYKREGIARIVAEWDSIDTKDVKRDSMKQPLEVEYVQRLFRRITDEDVSFMGFNPRWCRPDWMICSVLAIPPPQVRPSVVQENNQRSEDDLTHKLFEIIKTNKMLQVKMEADGSKANKGYIDELTNVLQYHIATLVDNQIPGVAPSAQRGGRPLKSIQQRLGSKEGRIRYNLQGKRVEFSARSVITPDPNISIAELGVPTKIAMNLTVPERVTDYNRDKLYKLVQNGSAVYPGAKTLVRGDGRMISLAHVNTKEIVLYNGDLVNRHLMDGDMVLFNRQPTLHRMSMMGHRVRVLPYNTFRLNVSVTSPYNADFDGDEMNAHIPQSSEAIQELQDIAAVPYQMISPRHQKPVIKVVQDALLGSHRITKQGEKFTRREYMNLMMWNKRFDGQLPQPEIVNGSTRWSGQQVLSMLFPPMNTDLKNKFYDDDPSQDNMVKIRDGMIQPGGIVDDDVLNKTGVGVVHTTYNDFGAMAAVDLLDSVQSTIEAYLVMSGFSVGLSDLVADDKTLATMNDIVQKRKKDIDEIVLQVHMDLFDNSTGKTNQDEFESQVFGKLNKAIEELGKLGQQALAQENRMISMLKAGSKGSTINVSQMVACVGQQNIEGRRIPYGFTDRTLPHYKKFDDGAEARGFVENSFVKGLTPQEFFFHAMSGREGLIDTAVKSVTGDTPIIVLENGQPKCVNIGDWIDAQLDHSPTEVEHFEERDMELLQLTQSTYIPTADLDGNVSWGVITAITRHDPGKELYEIKTSAGKRVIVTESKSLLIWNPDTKKFERMSTPDVRPGHFVPVTMNLPTPPIIINSVSLDKYLPKTEYIYGTDFNLAASAMLEAMTDRAKIPTGWWTENNGKAFILPYDSKARLQRALVRSEQIADGCVYPYHAKREVSISEKFSLNKENGIFLGLFLAEGNVDIKSGYIQITNNDANIRAFVTQWFAKQSIKTSEEIKMNAIGGISACVRGFSTVFASFLTAFVGHGAGNKFVPAEAFVAPEDFIIGLLNGYFSGDGTVSQNSVEVGSASSKLIDGISMLCTRIGIFGKVFTTTLKENNLGTVDIQSTTRLSIRAQWASKFAEKVELIDENKNKKLKLLSCPLSHRNYAKQNDVVLDEIIEINIIDVKQYPKVYDLTVPSTLNFGLANGLHVVDTAETGYLQRQMVKAMEDLVTQHDGTVRDARGGIVQFHYGEDGLSSTKVETQGLPLHNMSNEDIRKTMGLQGVEWAQVLSVARVENAELVNSFVDKVIEDRNMLVNGVFRNGRAKGLQGPMNLDRMILNLKVKFNIQATAQTDLTPEYVLERLNDLQARTLPFHKMWGAMLRFHLGPHNSVVKQRLTQIAFNALMEQILLKNWAAWAQPGEQVGIIAAQSIGEPATQMSAHSSSFIVLNSMGTKYSGSIGPFIDRILEANKDKVITIGENSVVLDLEEDIEILGVSNNEKTSWRRISQVSRHPANGGLVEVHTRSGRKTTATLTHSFLKRSPEGIVPVLGSDLKIGMRVPVAKFIPQVPNPTEFVKQGKTTFVLDKEFGWVCGIYLADGYIPNGNVVQISKIAPIVEIKLTQFCKQYKYEFTTLNRQGAYGPTKDNNIHSKDLKDFLLATFGQGSYTKTIGTVAYHAPLAFIQGLIGGFFDGDGNVSSMRQLIRASSRSKPLLEGINRLLGYCSMFGVLGSETSVRIPDKTQYTLTLPRKYAGHYKATIGFLLPEKANELNAIIEYNGRDDVKSKQEMIDKIPELGATIAMTGKLLKMPGQSRTYGRWLKKESIGRKTLEEYVQNFKDMMRVHVDPIVKDDVVANIALLESALASDVMWDEIVDLVYLDDPKEYVYDFTVPGNDSFMVDDNMLVHNTLNTFHLAGVAAKSGMTRGVPRLKEVFKVTKSPKAVSLSIFLKPEFRESKEKAREVAQDLELTMLRDIVTTVGLYYNPKDEAIVPGDKDLLAFYKLFEQRQLMDGASADEAQAAQADETDSKGKFSLWMLRLEFNKESMFNRNITMDDVAYVLNEKFSNSINMVYADFNSEKLIMRIRLGRDVLDRDVDDYALFKKFQATLMTTVAVRGVPGIKAVSFSKADNRVEIKDGKPEKVSEYILDTDGSNYIEVMNHPAVDPTRLYTTNVHDILDILGIEAARGILLSEIESLFADAGVNYRHLGLLIDSMTRNGRLMSVDRYGINKNNIGPLAKASFEETEKILLKAALFGEMDPVTGVSAKIMTGQPIRGGTTFSQLLLDEMALMRLQKGLPPVASSEEEDVDDIDDEDIAEELAVASDDRCNTVRLRMNAVMPDGDVDLEEPDVEFNVMD